MCHVLVIEDEPMVAMLLQDLFEEVGATSFAFAATERDAVCLAREHQPNLIASDVHLLEGTGPAAVKQIQDELGDVPVIFITATPEDCAPCQPPGVVLMKPINAREVKSAFCELAPL
ncbi:Response regulator receiver domain-containing protein [Sphingomonas gellani]|uniref:Response regulator receiver domain-containing protein n=1 Tax=Sphingomonas gellani TaxID=1166340 RepID=A0A1H7YBJ6_9SPHN|nr:response regulator [Sphingomonas gellani]SEM43562.1 Response regulator receiver domain-containing protein [Sphingomonas gellani]